MHTRGDWHAGCPAIQGPRHAAASPCHPNPCMGRHRPSTAIPYHPSAAVPHHPLALDRRPCPAWAIRDGDVVVPALALIAIMCVGPSPSLLGNNTGTGDLQVSGTCAAGYGSGLPLLDPCKTRTRGCRYLGVSTQVLCSLLFLYPPTTLILTLCSLFRCLSYVLRAVLLCELQS